MKDEKKSFEQDPNLLKQVFCDQAGDLNKGIMEAVQNLADGIFEAEEKGLLNRENAQIGIRVVGNELVIQGNGIGMTSEDANTVFKVFGISNKSGNSNRLGEKGMGRGQIISMVYDSSKDEMTGTCEVISGNRQNGGSIRIYDIDVPSLTFRIGTGANIKGTKWILTLDSGMWDDIEIRKYIEKNLSRLPIPLYFNAQKVNKKMTNENYTKVFKWNDALIGINKWGREFTLYERGLRVAEYEILSGFSGTIISKVPLKLNFARNDVKHDDPTWNKIKNELKRELLAMILDMKDVNIDGNKTEGILEAISDGMFTPHGKQIVMEKRIFNSANGDRLSINDIQRRGQVVWGSNRSRRSDAAAQSGYLVLPHTWEAEEVFGELGVETLSLDDVKITHSDSKTFEYTEIPKFKRQLIDFLEQFSHRQLFIGKSAGFKAWTDGVEKITWNDGNVPWEDVKEAIKTQKWDKVFWKMVKTLAHELAHDDNDEFTDTHGIEFYQRQVDEVLRITKEYAEMKRTGLML